MAISDHDGHAARAVAGVEHAFGTWFGCDPYTAEPEQHDDQEPDSRPPHPGVIQQTR